MPLLAGNPPHPIQKNLAQDIDISALLDKLNASKVPVGTIISFFSSSPPTGYFACNGDGFDQTAYPLLYAILGTAYVPNLLGMFLRCIGGNAATLGVAQGDAIRNIKTVATSPSTVSTASANLTTRPVWDGPLSTWAEANDGIFAVAPGGFRGGLKFDASQCVPVAVENRPVNIAVLYCIKHD
jgi:hypothetical protein